MGVGVRTCETCVRVTTSLGVWGSVGSRVCVFISNYGVLVNRRIGDIVKGYSFFFWLRGVATPDRWGEKRRKILQQIARLLGARLSVSVSGMEARKTFVLKASFSLKRTAKAAAESFNNLALIRPMLAPFALVTPLLPPVLQTGSVLGLASERPENVLHCDSAFKKKNAR